MEGKSLKDTREDSNNDGDGKVSSNGRETAEEASMPRTAPAPATMTLKAESIAVGGRYMTLGGGDTETAPTGGRSTSSPGARTALSVARGAPSYGQGGGGTAMNGAAVAAGGRNNVMEAGSTAAGTWGKAKKRMTAEKSGNGEAKGTELTGCSSGGSGSTTGSPASTTENRASRAKPTLSSSRKPRATNENFDFSFYKDYAGYNPSARGSRAERLKVRNQRTESPAAVGAESGTEKKRNTKSNVDENSSKLDSNPDGRAFVKPKPKDWDQKCLATFMRLVQRARKDRVSRGQPISSTREELGQTHWVRCCECGKHRAMPNGVSLDEMLHAYGLQHARVWVCPRNTWDPAFGSCMVPQACTSFTEAELFGHSTPLAAHGRNSSSGTGSESPAFAPSGTAVDSGSRSPASSILGKHRRSSNVDDDDDHPYDIDGPALDEGALSTVPGIGINDARSTLDSGVGRKELRGGGTGSDGAGGRSCRGDCGSRGSGCVRGKDGGAAVGSAKGFPRGPQPKRRCQGLRNSRQARSLDPLVIGPPVLGGEASGTGRSGGETGGGGGDAGGAEGAQGEGGGNQVPCREEQYEDLKADADILWLFAGRNAGGGGPGSKRLRRL